MNPKLVQNIQHVEKMHVTNVAAPVKQPGVPVCPTPNAATLYGRGAIIDQLVARLIGGAGAVGVSAVRGLPGVGKSDLLRAIGCDGRVVRHFGGGVLYAELGPDAEPLTLLTRWLYELDREVPQSDDPRTLAAVVRGALADRPALVILDDVWQSSMAAAQLLRECATGACRILLSSRSPELAETLAGGPEHAVKLDVLDADPALALLNAQAPQAVAKDAGGAKDLCAALGQLPLALKLAAALLRNDRRSAAPCRALLETWHRRLDELRGYERREGSAAEQLSLDAIIGMSYAALPDDATREAATALAVFGATPLSWDWDAMQAVWDADEAQAWERALIESGLLEYDAASGRYNLHQTVAAFLAQRFDDTQVLARHAAYHGWLIQKLSHELQAQQSVRHTLKMFHTHLRQIDRGRRLAARTAASPWRTQLLIAYAFACDTFFDIGGHYREKAEWVTDALEVAREANDEPSYFGLCNNLGVALLALGDYGRALRTFQLAEQYFRRNGQVDRLLRVLQNIGHVYQRQGQYDQAHAYYTDALAASERIGAFDIASGALIHIAAIDRLYRRYDAALTALVHAQEIRKRSGDTHGVAATYAGIAAVYIDQQRLDDARPLLDQALALYRTVGDVPHTADTLLLLGQLLAHQHDYSEAATIYRESYDQYRTIGNSAGMGAALSSLGSVYRAQERLPEAISAHRLSLQIFEDIGEAHNVAQVSWNLALALLQAGNVADAVPYIERSIATLEMIDAASPALAQRRAMLVELRSRPESP